MSKEVKVNFSTGNDIDARFRLPLILQRSAMTRLRRFWAKKIAEESHEPESDIVFRGVGAGGRRWAYDELQCETPNELQSDQPRTFHHWQYISTSKTLAMPRQWAGNEGIVMVIAHTSGAFIYPIGES